MKDNLMTIYKGFELRMQTTDDMSSITGGRILKEKKEIARLPMRKPWQFNKSNKGKMSSMLKELADKNSTPLDTISEKISLIKETENEIEEIASAFVKASILRILKSHPGSPAVLNIKELCENENRFEETNYGAGVTLYGKHYFYETGLLRQVSIKEEKIKCVFAGVESGCEEILMFDELEYWSQHSIACMVKEIEKGINEGEIILQKFTDSFAVTTAE